MQRLADLSPDVSEYTTVTIGHLVPEIVLSIYRKMGTYPTPPRRHLPLKFPPCPRIHWQIQPHGRTVTASIVRGIELDS
eukprot:756856-Hanusia_phi.AAC.1